MKEGAGDFGVAGIAAGSSDRLLCLAGHPDGRRFRADLAVATVMFE